MCGIRIAFVIKTGIGKHKWMRHESLQLGLILVDAFIGRAK